MKGTGGREGRAKRGGGVERVERGKSGELQELEVERGK